MPIVAGTDAAVPGFSIYREIELYVKARFTPMETLQAAAIVGARVMKVDAESGNSEVGKRADLDVLDGNPLDDIHNIRTVRIVLANGALYDPKPLSADDAQSGSWESLARMQATILWLFPITVAKCYRFIGSDPVDKPRCKHRARKTGSLAMQRQHIPPAMR